MTKRNTKAERLKALKSLNRHPERVRAPWFQTGTFFDAQDLVQVKYEMLRHVSQDGASKADSAALFGLSRPAFYQAEAALDREGLAGLLPRQRGPKGAHKLTAQIMSFIERRQVEDPEIHARALAREIKAQLKLSVHPRSIERALARKKNSEHSRRDERALGGAADVRAAARGGAQRSGPSRWTCRDGLSRDDPRPCRDSQRAHSRGQVIAISSTSSRSAYSGQSDH